MPEGGTITVETANRVLRDNEEALRRNLKTGPYVSVSIVDKGDGIRPDILSRVMEPFFCPSNTGVGEPGSRQGGEARRHDRHTHLCGRVLKCVGLTEALWPIGAEQGGQRPLPHGDEGGHAGAVRRPGLATERPKGSIDPGVVEARGEVVWTVARALLVMDRSLPEAVLVVDARHERACIIGERIYSCVPRETWVARGLLQHVDETAPDARHARLVPLPGDNGHGFVEGSLRLVSPRR